MRELGGGAWVTMFRHEPGVKSAKASCDWRRDGDRIGASFNHRGMFAFALSLCRARGAFWNSTMELDDGV